MTFLSIDAEAEVNRAGVGNSEEYSAQLIPCECDGLWGYCDKDGTWVLAPQWSSAGWFRNGTAAVCSLDKQWGIINEQGDYLVSCIFDSIQDQYSYYEYTPYENPLNYIGGLTDGFYLIENHIDGEVVMGFYCIATKSLVEPQWCAVYIAEADYGTNELILVEDWELGFGFVDRYGNIVIQCQYEWASPFVNGVADVQSNNNGEYYEFCIDLTGTPLYDAK